MEKCRLTIITKADEQENRLFVNGTMDVTTEEFLVCYDDDDANVRVAIRKEEVEIVRRGEYTLRLLLKAGERCKGSIGIANSEGEVETLTKSIACEYKADGLMLGLEYDLLIGAEPQKMKIRLLAKKI